MLVNLFASSSCLLSLLLFLAQTIIILTLFGYSFQKVLVFAWLVIQHFQSFWHAVILSLGQQPQNPLLLLGQYSDDEADDGSSKGPNDKKVESPMLNEEVLYYLHISLKAKPRFFFYPICILKLFVRPWCGVQIDFLDLNINNLINCLLWYEDFVTCPHIEPD